MSGNINDVINVLRGAILLDSDDEALTIVGGGEAGGVQCVVTMDTKKRLRLIDMDDIRDETYWVFADKASADAHLADQETSAEKAA